MATEIIEDHVHSACDCESTHHTCNFCLKQSPLVETNSLLGKLTLTNIMLTMLMLSVVLAPIGHYISSRQTDTSRTQVTGESSKLEPTEEIGPPPPVLELSQWDLRDSTSYSESAQADYNKQLQVDSIKQFDDEIKANPHNASAYMERGWIYSQSGMNSRALKDLNKAISLSPTDANIWLKRGWINYECGKSQKALKDARKAIRLEPSNSDAYDLQSTVYGSLGNQSLAETSARTSIQLQMRSKPLP